MRASGILLPVSSSAGALRHRGIFPGGPRLCGLAGRGGPEFLADSAAGSHRLRRPALISPFPPLQAIPISFDPDTLAAEGLLTDEECRAGGPPGMPRMRWITAGCTGSGSRCCAAPLPAGRRPAAAAAAHTGPLLTGALLAGGLCPVHRHQVGTGRRPLGPVAG